jgi:hypothetical protein
MRPSILELAYDGSYVCTSGLGVQIYRLGEQFYGRFPSGNIYPVGDHLLNLLFTHS